MRTGEKKKRRERTYRYIAGGGEGELHELLQRQRKAIGNGIGLVVRRI